MDFQASMRLQISSRNSYASPMADCPIPKFVKGKPLSPEPSLSRTISSSLKAQSSRCDSVRRRISKSTSAVTFLSNDGTSAFSRLETTATAGAIGISSASTSDELGACRRWSRTFGLSVRRSCRGIASVHARGSDNTTQCLCSIRIGRGISESASSVALLSDNRPGAFPGFESTTTRGAFRVGFACSGDELGT